MYNLTCTYLLQDPPDLHYRQGKKEKVPDDIFSVIPRSSIFKYPDWYTQRFPSLVPGSLLPHFRQTEGDYLMDNVGEEPYPWEDVSLFLRIQKGKPLKDVKEELRSVLKLYHYCIDERKWPMTKAYSTVVLAYKERMKRKDTYLTPAMHHFCYALIFSFPIRKY